MVPSHPRAHGGVNDGCSMTYDTLVRVLTLMPSRLMVRVAALTMVGWWPKRSNRDPYSLSCGWILGDPNGDGGIDAGGDVAIVCIPFATGYPP